MSIKVDEVEFIRELLRYQETNQLLNRPFATDLGMALGFSEKRCAYILDKWSDRGDWDYGVSLRTGWLTEKGITKARELTR